MKPPSFVIHDTLIILRADEATHELFSAAPGKLIGVKLVDLVDDQDFRGLISFRMRFARETEAEELPEIDLIFRRFDGTHFEANVKTLRLKTAGEWESSVRYIREI